MVLFSETQAIIQSVERKGTILGQSWAYYFETFRHFREVFIYHK